MAAPIQLTRMHRILIGVVVAGALVIAGIGFAGSYAAVRELALKKGFGNFAYVFPIGIDAGICVLLALDLLLTWIRIPFPLLRQTAWLLTVATIAFNGAAAWPDPLGVGMHAVIPILFVVSVEAARHATGRIADITADKHMEGVRLTRWMLSPLPTFLLWRRMKLWELRSYEQVIKLEQERLVYQARLRSRFGRAWRRKAPVESLMPLRLARYGVPLAETAPSGLAAAGIEPALLPPAPVQVVAPAPVPAAPEHRELESSPAPARQSQPPYAQEAQAPEPDSSPWFASPAPQETVYEGGYDPEYVPEEQYQQWYEEQQAQAYEPGPEETGTFPIPAGPGRTRQLGEGVAQEQQEYQEQLPIPAPREEQSPLSDEKAREESLYQVFRQSIMPGQGLPTKGEFGGNVEATYGVTLTDSELRRYMSRFQNRFNTELEEDHIA
ncbi:DUF2637 domain-containing protein [Streptomyces sp. NBC_01340]|uniref:DUF2637 domain-containing protein n=1 Tax=unclassified Streptomyces TaxID=2593676 RepID=UPI00225A5856|nr:MULTISPECIES: DUF2637 domain-containing protein [unclassified Streptomyces]MCX4455944.1 DUF2637 domain-containing protein [Streptomyces sp. NBC_01719]MCX4495304.1 DUF2637 domain-containing protein [Streptomyces sp. NBC_01728]MCX4590130.1 DUF2637 domain-containing protein [Streptomyces sp. NBC_01549]WSI40268.1 DUF2637 domain-containing protein [Streptomyces sp. NBC_01340]